MRNLASVLEHAEHQIEQWALPILLLVFSWIAVRISRRILESVSNRVARLSEHHRKRLQFIRSIAEPLSRIIYILGLKGAVDSAPLSAKVELWGDHVIYVLTILIFLSLMRRAALVGIEWSAMRTLKSSTLQLGFIPLLKNLVTLFFFFTGVIMVLKHFNYDVLSLLTALGVGSLAVGLAAKETLANMISGFTLIIDRNLSPGDRVNLGGSIGDVDEIGLRSTRIRLPNGSTLIVPNSDMVNTKIINLSVPTRAQSTSSIFRVSLETPLSQVREIAFACMKEIPSIAPDRGQFVHLASIADGIQTLNAGFWVADLEQEGRALSDFNERMISILTQQGIVLQPPLNLQNLTRI